MPVMQLTSYACGGSVPTIENIRTILMMDDARGALDKQVALKRMVLRGYEDIKLYGSTLFDIYEQFGENGGFDITTGSGNRIVLSETTDIASMKRTRLYFRGAGSSVFLNGLRAIRSLDIACIDGSTAALSRPLYVRGMTMVSSHGSEITIKRDCMMSTDILLYATRVHGLFNVSDGNRRGRTGVHIGEHVWIGQGVRILAGASVGPGSVVGSYSVLAGKIPNNCAAAGNPCRVTSRDIFWTSETIHENYFDHCSREGRSLPSFIRKTE